MNRGGQFLLTLCALLATTACDGRVPGTPGSLPSQGPRGSVNPDLPPIYAEISLHSISPEAGSSLWLRGCQQTEGSHAGSTYCTEDLQVAFDITVDRDLASVALRLAFMYEGERCASGETPRVPVNAHAPAQLRTSLVHYVVGSGEPTDSLGPGCAPPPVSTTTMVVELIDYSHSDAGESVMSWTFPYGYRFAVRPTTTN